MTGRFIQAMATVAAVLMVSIVALVAPRANADLPRGGDVIAYSVKTGIYSVRPNGTGLRLLVPWQPSSCGKGCVVWKVPRNPRYSPNGQQLIYDMETYVVHNGVGSGAEPDTRTVYLADANGQHRRRLGLGHNPEFSSDGREVVYMLNPNAYPRPPLLEEPPEFGEDDAPMEAVNLQTAAHHRLPVPGASEFSPGGKKMLIYSQVRVKGAIT